MAKVYKVDNSFDFSMFTDASVAFGVFDGVHRGHQFLFSEACKTASENGGCVIALTFNIDPDEVFHADRLKKLMTNETRIATLAASGVDAVVVLPFTGEFAAQEPMEFLYSLFKGYAPYALHVGFDFHFGAHAKGNVNDLRVWARQFGTHIYAHDLASYGEKPITATRIRLLLADGKCEEALTLLGHSYSFEGVVTKGRGEGASMGFATANLTLPAMLQTLGEGVYAAWVSIDGVRYKSAMSVGIAPMFADAQATCEAHILDFSGDIYGDVIEIEPVCLLRPMMEFDSVEELIATVKANIEWVRSNL